MAASAEPIKVRHPQGSAHGFVDVRTLDGARIGVGDLMQRARGNRVSSQLTLHFLDGSIDDETTVFTQQGWFRLVSDHHVQHGPSFPHPVDVTIDAAKQLVSYKDDAGGLTQSHIHMPPDIYNGLASSMLMNFPPGQSEARIAVIIVASKPRVVQLSMKNEGDSTVTLGGVPRNVINYRVHVELGGVAGVVAPLIGKAPPDYHVLILGGEDPAFIREEGPLFAGGPILRVQQISAEFSDNQSK